MDEAFQRVFGAKPEVAVRAPGRVNLIGEHTDYNSGYVLPAAIDRAITMAGRRRSDRTVRLHSLDLDQISEFSLDSIERDARHPWSNYVRGVSKLLEAGGHTLPGAEIIFGGDVPREAGLSSSAALEVAAVAFWQKLARLELAPVNAVKLARRAENEFVGVPCGVMDQFASALAREGHAGIGLVERDARHQHFPGPVEALGDVGVAARRRQRADRVGQPRRAAPPPGVTRTAPCDERGIGSTISVGRPPSASNDPPASRFSRSAI